jgi:capsular polysaccharide biosynthesis protein
MTQESVSDTAAAISGAKDAMRNGDFESALAAFQSVDVAVLEPLAAVRALVHMGKCLDALGRKTECASSNRTALTIYAAAFLTPATLGPDRIRTALSLAMGAQDTAATKDYLRMLAGELPPFAQDFKISPLMSLPAWGRAHGVPVEILDPAEEIEITDDAGTARAFRYTSSQTWHAVIPNGEIVSGWDFVVAPTGEILNGANYLSVDITFPFMPHGYNSTLNSVAHVWPAQSTFVDADALFLSAPEKHHFGHWIVDFLTRLRVWNIPGEPRRKIVISSQLPRKHRDLLGCFGVRPDDLIACDLGRRYKFRSLRVVRTGSADAPNPHNVKFLYRALGPSQSINATGNAGTRLFLVRDAGTRMLANEAEVDQVFHEFGITKVNPAKLTLAEQTALLARTELIIGAFGTELFCLYNMPVGSTVVELIWDKNHATVYGPTCSFLGIKHHLMVCETVENTATARRKVSRDLVVDCAELRQRLASITRA